MISGLAHTGVCVPDCEAAAAVYRDVLGLRLLCTPPEVREGNEQRVATALTDHGFSHVGLICEGLDAIRAASKGVRFFVAVHARGLDD